MSEKLGYRIIAVIILLIWILSTWVYVNDSRIETLEKQQTLENEHFEKQQALHELAHYNAAISLGYNAKLEKDRVILSEPVRNEDDCILIWLAPDNPSPDDFKKAIFCLRNKVEKCKNE